MKYALLPLLMTLTLVQSSFASNRCEAIYSEKAELTGVAFYRQPGAPLLSAEQVVEIYQVKASQAPYFISRYEREVLNERTWAQAGNPRISPSRQSLIVDMYRLQDRQMEREEIQALLRENRSVPGKIIFKHILFNFVL